MLLLATLHALLLHRSTKHAAYSHCSFTFVGHPLLGSSRANLATLLVLLVLFRRTYMVVGKAWNLSITGLGSCWCIHQPVHFSWCAHYKQMALMILSHITENQRRWICESQHIFNCLGDPSIQLQICFQEEKGIWGYYTRFSSTSMVLEVNCAHIIVFPLNYQPSVQR